MGKGSGGCAQRPAIAMANTRVTPFTMDDYYQPQNVWQATLLQHATDPAVAQQRRIALDIDETIYPLVPTMNALPGGEKLTYKEYKYWFAMRDLVGGKEKAFALIQEATKFKHSANTGTFKDVPAALQILRHYGITLDVMTHRDPNRLEDTEQYLQKNNVIYDSLTVSYDLDKVQVCQDEGIELLVDDKPDTIADAAKAGLKVVTLVYPYNRDVIREHQIPWARGWERLTGLILDAVGQNVARELGKAQQEAVTASANN